MSVSGNLPLVVGVVLRDVADVQDVDGVVTLGGLRDPFSLRRVGLGMLPSVNLCVRQQGEGEAAGHGHRCVGERGARAGQ